MRTLFFLLLTLIFARPLLLPSSAHAQLLEWSSTNVQALHGQGFKLTDDTQTTLTFEHVNGWKYGDNFFYIDYAIDRPGEWNFEYSPRLSLSKITGADFSCGIIQDVLLSGTWERAQGFDARLYGIGVDLRVPGFNFVQVNGYVRDNTAVDRRGLQTTVVWSRPFQVNDYKLTFDGYFDLADYEEGDVNFFTQPQLLLDIGDALGIAEEGHAFAGIEYRYWHNKFGIEGVTESVPQIMVKWNF